ncbi:hypothetical protein Golob_024478 [Gossypium lobatum]|uniref:Uncharacterized protein n=1 Tax=Gossypium lobatum TaxID=34289 RepID=A0A7J8NEG8_9ROSI|nr:hypothetical protein [Gossypium lobatum]
MAIIFNYLPDVPLKKKGILVPSFLSSPDRHLDQLSMIVSSINSYLESKTYKKACQALKHQLLVARLF